MSCLVGGILTLWGVSFLFALVIGICAAVIGSGKKSADESYEAAQGEALDRVHEEGYRRGPRVEDHDVNSRNCWCEPELLQLCPERVGELDDYGCSVECWRCRGKGWVDPYDADRTIIVVHRRNLLRRGA